MTRFQQRMMVVPLAGIAGATVWMLWVLDGARPMDAMPAIPTAPLAAVPAERGAVPAVLVEPERSAVVAPLPSSPYCVAAKAAVPVSITSVERCQAWAKDEPVFQYCVNHPNGPWALMPTKASELELANFRVLLQAALTDHQARLVVLGAAHDPGSEAWLTGAREIDLDAQERYASIFARVWPNARQPDPVVRSEH
jgi:hypothetical protein